MDNDLTLFDKILYGSLSPSLDENKPDEKFESIISQIETVFPCFQTLYEIDFYRHFNNRTQYYHKLIINEANAYCNHIVALINADENSKLQKYWYNDTLKKKLVSKLKAIGKTIREKKYDIDIINPRNTNVEIDADLKTETYIIHLLKLALIKTYLEIQEVFKHLTTEELFIEDDLYARFIKEQIPEKSFLKVVYPVIDVEQAKVNVQESIVKISFNSFRYKQYDTANDNLSDLWDSLRKNNFIASDTKVADFKKIFSGNKITKPIYWTGNASEFYYFIQLIYTINEFVEDLKQKQWLIASKCFIQEDGSKFEKSKLRGLKKPQLTHKLLEQVVNHLK